MNSHRNRWLSQLAAAVAVLLAVVSCAAPSVLNTQWSNPSFPATPMPTITVRQSIVADTRRFEARDSQIVWTASTTSGSGSTTALP